MLTKYKETKRKEEKIMIKPKICKMQRFRASILSNRALRGDTSWPAARSSNPNPKNGGDGLEKKGGSFKGVKVGWRK